VLQWRGYLIDFSAKEPAMTLELRLDHSARLAQTLHIRSHELRTDISEAEGAATPAPARMISTMPRWAPAKP
jgi:hypothetical protein